MFVLIKWEMNDMGEWKPFRVATSSDRKVLDVQCKEGFEVIYEDN